MSEKLESQNINLPKTFVSPADYFICLANSKRTKAAELPLKGGDFNEAAARLLERQTDILERLPHQGTHRGRNMRCYLFVFPLRLLHCWTLDHCSLVRNLGKYYAEYFKTQQRLEESSEALRSFGIGRNAEELQRMAVEVADRAFWVEVETLKMRVQ